MTSQYHSQNLPADFNKVVEKIGSKLASKYVFGTYEKEDILQEIYLLCLKALPKYDDSRSLYNFLFTHVDNRLYNLKRDNYFRPTCPCKLCDFKNDGETDHPDGKYCKVYKNWYKVNCMKSNLAKPIGFSDGFDVISNQPSQEDEVDMTDFLDMIDRELPIDLRSTYLKLRAGVSVGHQEKARVLEFLKKYTEF